MQWSAAKNAGFTDGEPWLPVAEDYTRVNVEAERHDPRSILTFYSQLIKVRRGERALEVGRFEPLEADGDLFAYMRRDGDSVFLIALNFGLKSEVINFSDKAPEGKVVLSTHLDRSGDHVHSELHLRPEEGLLVNLVSSH